MQSDETQERVNRLALEAGIVRNKLRVNVSWGKTEGHWFYVERLPLPYGWNRSVADILIDIPHGTPGYPQVPPKWFWTNRDLATNDGRSIQHFFDFDSGSVDQWHWEKGYGHFCIHLADTARWRPLYGVRLDRGDNLLTYLRKIQRVFHDQKTLVK